MVDISSFSMIQFYLLVWKKWNKSKEKIQETLIIDAFADEKLTVLEVTTTIQTSTKPTNTLNIVTTQLQQISLPNVINFSCCSSPHNETERKSYATP